MTARSGMKIRTSLPKFPHQFFYFTAMRLRQMMLRLSNWLSLPQMTIYEKAQGFWVSRAIAAACELNLADHLEQGPKSIAELAHLSGTEPNSLYRLMRMLAGEGIFRELPGKVFENNRLSCSLREGEGSMRNLIMHQFSETNLRLFLDFSGVIRSGESYSRRILGKPVFQFLQENPQNNELYNRAMDDSSGLVSLALLSAYNFEKFRSIVDIGGGHGIVLCNILKKYKKLHGVLFDQSHVVEKAKEIIADSGLEDRIRIVPGNFFDEIPKGFDGYFMKNILHAFNDEDCEQLLCKLREVLPPDGKLIIMETVISSDNKPALGKRLDLLMMAGTEGGKERTREEYEILLKKSGLKLNRLIRTVAPFSILEAVKG